MDNERKLVEAIKEEVRGTDSSVSWHVAMRKGETYGADSLRVLCVVLRERVCGSCFYGILLGAFSSMLGLDATRLHETIFTEPWKEEPCEIH